MKPLINKTGRAVITICVLVWACATLTLPHDYTMNSSLFTVVYACLGLLTGENVLEMVLAHRSLPTPP